MSNYEYVDEEGNVVGAMVKDMDLNKCPKCGSEKLKDKGSFSKCLNCFERISTHSWWGIEDDTSGQA